MKKTRINGKRVKKEKINKFRPVTLKNIQFSKNKILVHCNFVILNGDNKLYKIESIVSTPLKQNKTRKILTKGTIIKIANSTKLAKIITKVRYSIPHAAYTE